jgi:uncharacterized protein YwqG
MRKADPSAWRRYLIEKSISPELAGAWSEHARPRIVLSAMATHADDPTAVGSSKLGGLPDLPTSTPWPTRPAYQYPKDSNGHLEEVAWEEQPLTFLAQLNLRDLARVGCQLPIPESGLLSFFYDAQTQPWGFDPLDAPGSRVIFTEEGTPLQRRPHPLGHSCPVQSLDFTPGEDLPSLDWVQEYWTRQAQGDLDTFLAQAGELGDERLDDICHGGFKFGGWPSPIQSPMELDCELVTNGVHVGDPEGYRDPRVAALAPRAADWRLLLQLTSNDELQWMWGDMGTLYIMCREEDIAQRRFDRAWTVLQCS